MGATKVPLKVVLRISAFLVPHNHTPLFTKPSKASGHGVVIAHKAIAMKLQEIFKGILHVVEHEGPLGIMARNLDPLPWREPPRPLTPLAKHQSLGPTTHRSPR